MTSYITPLPQPVPMPVPPPLLAPMQQGYAQGMLHTLLFWWVCLWWVCLRVTYVGIAKRWLDEQLSLLLL